jgi:predicted GIY-YIG superfamily endonuclease
MRPIDIEIPTNKSGYVYILGSVRDENVTYIGTTSKLSHRFYQHNSGYGSKTTNSLHLRPWCLLAFITGFSGYEQQMRQNRYNIEKDWKIEIRYKQNTVGQILTREECVKIGKTLIQSDVYKNLHLKFVHTVQFLV